MRAARARRSPEGDTFGIFYGLAATRSFRLTLCACSECWRSRSWWTAYRPRGPSNLAELALIVWRAPERLCGTRFGSQRRRGSVPEGAGAPLLGHASNKGAPPAAVGAGRVRQLLGVALAAGASADIARWCGKCRDSRPVAARSVAHLYFSPRGPCPPCTESGSSTEKLRLTSLRFALRRRKDKKNKQANSLQKLCRCVLAGPDHTFWRLRCLLASCSTALPIGSLCT